MIRFAIAGAVCLSLAACSTGNQQAMPCSNAASAETAKACGGMSALVAKARAEGRLDVIGLPREWANYGALIDGFHARYGISVVSSDPTAGSQQELDTAKQMGRSGDAPDVFDLRTEVAAANADRFAPYEVATWDEVYINQKDPIGRWTQDYGGYISIGYDSNEVPAITSMQDLLNPAFPAKVALKGEPSKSDAGLYAVMMANLAQTGPLGDVSNGVDYFHSLRLAGKLNFSLATLATVKNGTTPVVFDWDFEASQYLRIDPAWRTFIPTYPTLGYYFAQAINKEAPHPAAARLWEEYLYSSEGQQLLMDGGAAPVLVRLLRPAPTDPTMPNLDAPPMFMSTAQMADARAYLAAHWIAAIS